MNHWRFAICAGAVLAAASVLEAPLPTMTSAAVFGDTHLGAFVAYALVTGMCVSARSAAFRVIGAHVRNDTRKRMVSNLMAMDAHFFDQASTGKIVSVIDTDVEKVARLFEWAIHVVLRSIVRMSVTFAFMAAVDTRLTLIMFISVPICGAFTHLMGKCIEHVSAERDAASREASSLMHEVFMGQATLTVMGAVDYATGKVFDRFERAFNASLKTIRLVAQYGTLINYAAPIVSTATLIAYRPGRMQPGDLMAFVLYAQAMHTVFGDVATVVVDMHNAADPLHHVMRYCRMGTDARTFGTLHPVNQPVHVEFAHVSFAYPTRPERWVIDRFCMRVHSGSIVVLAGASGSGKSTLFHLLTRERDATRGIVSIDEVNIQAYSEVWIRRNVGLVPQHTMLFSGTVRDNLTMGCSYLEAEIERACRLAHAHAFITTRLPGGYEADIGQNGRLLSGGQRQRIAVVRAILKRPQLLLMDEPTASLDDESARALCATVDLINIEYRATVLISSHDLARIGNHWRVVRIDAMTDDAQSISENRT